MNPRGLTLNEMLTYESVLKTYEDEIFDIPTVHGLGIGYRHQGTRLTNEIALVVFVTPEYDFNHPRIRRYYGYMRSQTIQMPRLNEQSSKRISLLQEQRFQVVDPIVGGVQIGNSNLCKHKSGVLGAIVFDATGDPLGLSVQHAIGDHQTARSMDCDCPVCVNATEKTQGEKKSWWVPEAAPGNAISQPNSFDTKNKIGELYKINFSLDAAIFRLNTQDGARKIEARVDGIPGELGEPVKPRLGTECWFRGAKTHTEGRIWFVGKMKTDGYGDDLSAETFGRKLKTRIQIGFEVTGEHRTSGGDSGGLWITKDGLHPVGLHTAQVPGFGYAVATSIQQLTQEFHPFTFSPVQYRTMLDNTRDYHTAFVDAPDGNGFFTFCVTTVGADPVRIQKYDDRAAPVGNMMSRSNIDALNGLSAATHGNNVYAIWQTMSNDEMRMSQWDSRGNLLSTYGIANRYSIFKPELVRCGGAMVMAYVDRSGKLRLRVTDGWNWMDCRYQSQRGIKKSYASKVVSAPALAALGERLFAAWVENHGDEADDRRIRLMEIEPDLNASYSTRYSRIVRSMTLPAKYFCKGGVDLTVSTVSEELVLAMSSHGGALVTIALALDDDWSNSKWTETNVLKQNYVSDNPPSLFCHDGRVICTRERMSGE